MITPSFSPTATERVLPRLALDFTTGVLDPRVTVTRALNTATRTNASGLIEIVNANLPRFDYDGATLASKGLLIEESRANLFTYSEAFNGAGWTTAEASIDPNVVTSPDGTSNADKLIENTAAGVSHRVFQTFTTSATTYGVSVYTKQAGRIKLYIREGSLTGNYGAFDIANGTVLEAVGATATITNVGNGWYRCTVVMGALAGSSRFDIGLLPDNWTAGSARTYTGDGVSGVYLYGAQLEVGTFATSYIPNLATGSTTRNADVVQMTGTNFSSWYNASEGAIYAEGSRFTTVNFSAQVAISNGNTSNEISMCSCTPAFGGTSANATMRASGVGADAYIGPTAVNTTAKMMVAYGATNAFSVNGSAASAIASAVPTADRMIVGARGNGSTQLNGHVRKIMYYPQRLTDREIQAFSK